MKRIIFSALVLSSTLLFAAGGESAGAQLKPGFGLSSFGGPGNAPAFSGIVHLAPAHSVQITFSIPNSGATTVGGGFTYRARLAGNAGQGAFHVGLGSTIGAVASVFTFNAFPVVGMHFNPSERLSNLVIHLDGGATFTFTPAFNFALAPLSALLGASIHYVF